VKMADRVSRYWNKPGSLYMTLCCTYEWFDDSLKQRTRRQQDVGVDGSGMRSLTKCRDQPAHRNRYRLVGGEIRPGPHRKVEFATKRFQTVSMLTMLRHGAWSLHH
jgi:hypothetical protein